MRFFMPSTPLLQTKKHIWIYFIQKKNFFIQIENFSTDPGNLVAVNFNKKSLLEQSFFPEFGE